MSAARIPPELLYDSAESLRRADRLLSDWRGRTAQPTMVQQLESDAQLMPPLPEILHRAFGEIVHLLDNLSRSRSILEQAAVDRLHRTNAKLREITSTTESAATSILDSLERGLFLLGVMDVQQPEHGTAERTELRDLLHGILAELQFQDITSQQLSHASTMLEDLEARLRGIAELIDASVLGGEFGREHAALEDVQGQHFDPAATATDATDRQALADQIFS